MSNEKQIVWLPMELAEKVKAVTSEEGIDKIVMDHIEKTKSGMTEDIDCLEEDVLRYKALLVGIRTKLKEAYKTHATELEKVWDNHAENLGVMEKKVKQLVKTLDAKLREIEGQCRKVSSWEIDNFVESIRKLDEALKGSSGDMLKFVVENFKRD